MTDKVLKEEERVAFALRSLYKKYGYLPYKMSKFEAYDLYAANKQFLIGDGVITFTDTDGRLLALKPDVTLSIIKNSADGQGKRKVYYHENVYRISGGTKQFKEIPQVGLECIGDVDDYDVYEAITLAAGSLAAISDTFVLDISHLGILFAVLQEIGKGEEFAQKVTRCLAEKNAHALAELCEEEGVAQADKVKLQTLLTAYGKMQKVLEQITPICTTEAGKTALERLKKLCDLLKESPYADKLRLDFSVVNDRNYYDDVLFKGFVDGVADSVLSGGRYDRLMARMGKKSSGIGFAVNLDLLENLDGRTEAQDVDVLVSYGENTPVAEVAAAVEKQIRQGKTVRAQKGSTGVRYGQVIDLTGGEK